MIDVGAVTRLQAEETLRWHGQPVDNLHEGFLHLVCEQHASNFRLWHEEDQARDPQADDAVIAAVKRRIDRENQHRNDLIEALDAEITCQLREQGITPTAAARHNSETPGSIIDRLSIMTLRIYHLREQIRRPDADEAHVLRVAQKLHICHIQRDDLAASLRHVGTEIFAGRLRHRVYRQNKMYNDPSLNPHLAAARRAA